MEKKRREPGIKEWVMIFAAGAVLLVLSVPGIFPDTVKKTAAPVTQPEPVQQREDYISQTEKRLEEFLLGFEGITSVRVILTVKSTSERVILSDTSTKQDSLSETDSSGGTRSQESKTEEKKAVIDGAKEPYLIYERMPQAEGIAVIISGEGREKILEISEAVQALFNLPAHKVKVIWNS